MFPRIVVGRGGVAEQVRAAAPLMSALRAPIPARGPWLTAVLNHSAGRRGGGRPVAVVVEPRAGGGSEAVAFLTVRRRGLSRVVTMLGHAVGPQPGGRPARRLLARNERAAEALADGVRELLTRVRGRLDLDGLPLGDPTARALAAHLPDAVIATARSEATVDELDAAGPVERSRHPRDLERWLPELLAREPDVRSRAFLRSAARLHAAVGQVEVAVITGPAGLRAGLLTLVEGADRWPWWGWSDIGGLRSAMGAPSVSLGEPARGWP